MVELRSVPSTRKPTFPWGRLIARMESEGQWSDIVFMAGAWMYDDSWRELPRRVRASVARALAFLGRSDESDAFATSVLVDKQVDDAFVIATLARAARLRRDHVWPEAESCARSALDGAEMLRDHSLIAESRFALALAWNERGRWGAALEVFQEMRQDERVSGFRRELAALNEAWLLWDRGQPEHLSDVIAFVPAAFRSKILVYEAAWRDREDWLLERADLGFDGAVSPADEEQILLILCEWAATGEGGAPGRGSMAWLRSQVEDRARTSAGDASAKYRGLLALLDGREFDPEHGTDKGGVLDVELWTIRACSLAVSSPERALQVYRDKVAPLMKSQRMHTPLLPSLEDLSSARFGWTLRLACAFGLKPRPGVELGVCSDTTLILAGSDLRRSDVTHKSLSLARSPTSRGLAEALVGRRGRRFAKAEIHRRVSRTPYRADLHDARLHKLLKRLADRVEQDLGVRPWAMPGDNSVELLVDVEAK